MELMNLKPEAKLWAPKGKNSRKRKHLIASTNVLERAKAA